MISMQSKSRATAQAMTKKVADRNQAVLYGFAFLQAYQAARGAPQEAAYKHGPRRARAQPPARRRAALRAGAAVSLNHHLLCTPRAPLYLLLHSIPLHAAGSQHTSRHSCCVASACASLVNRVLGVRTNTDAVMILPPSGRSQSVQSWTCGGRLHTTWRCCTEAAVPMSLLGKC